MKKTYIAPTTDVVEIELNQIIAASLNGVTETGGEAQLTEETAESGTDAMARGFEFSWDEGCE